MKRLILMRHAQAERRSKDGLDEHRALHHKGVADVRKVGEHLQAQNIIPQLIVHSTAERTKETAWTLCEIIKPAPMSEGLGELYLSPEEAMLDAVQRTEATVDTLMIVGHNPGIGDLALTMVDNPTGVLRAFPTAAVAIIDLGIDDWSEARHGHLYTFNLAEELG